MAPTEVTRRKPRPGYLARREARLFWALVSPWILGFLVFQVVIYGYGLFISLYKYDGISFTWVGLKNYASALSNPETLQSFGITAQYTAISVPLSVIAALCLAVLLNQKKVKGLGAWRTVSYMPAVIPIVAAALIWSFMFNYNSGPINYLLNLLHLPMVRWGQGPPLFWAMIIMCIWGIGPTCILYLAALQGVPADLAEAASIDGASPWRRFRSLTLPIISPVVFFHVLTGIIAAMQIFVQAVILSRATNNDVAQNPLGGAVSQRESNFIVIHMMYKAFREFKLGYASAVSWLLFVALAGLSVVVFLVGKRLVYYEVDARKDG